METNHKDEFEKLCSRAKRNGLLRVAYPDHGIAILAIPRTPPPDPTPAPPPSPPAATAPPPV